MFKNAKKSKVVAISVLLILSISAYGITSLGYVEDVQSTKYTANRSPYPFPDHYPSVEELYDWYDDLVVEFPNLVSKVHIGTSYEGRDLWVLEVTSDEDTQVDYKPGFFVDGNMHAREWSGNQVSAYFMWRLLNEYDTNETIYWLLNNRRIYVMPMQNPDGYTYDGDGGVGGGNNWRKNRNDSTPTAAIGVDLNRNWDIMWESGNPDPGFDDYRGEAPFSEYENWHERDFILNNSIDSYQNIHSYAGTLLIPLCYSSDPSPHDDWYRGMASHMTSLTSLMGDENSHYSFGQPHEEIGYSAPGGAGDWTYDALGIQSMVFELETGGGGFYPGTDDIMTINQDVDDSLVYQCRVADTDLGDGTNHLYPPIPYIVYGRVEDPEGVPVAGMEVVVENKDTGETISIDTDGNGYYELNYGNLVERGYALTDTFHISAWTNSQEFNIGDEWGRRIDMEVVVGGVPPEITLTSPNGGEQWHAFDEEDITWTTNQGDDPIDHVDLWYSVDAGTSWDRLDTEIDDTGSYTWTVSNEHSQECHVRARVIDSLGRWGEDVSDNVFEIVGLAPGPPRNLTVEHDSAPHMGIFDDFANGNYDNWTVYDGSWDATSGYLQGHGSISTPAEMHQENIGAYGRWEIDFQLSEISDASGYQITRSHFIQIDNADPRYSSGYYVIITGNIGGNGQINLWRWDNGSTPGSTTAGASWNPNTDTNTLAIERDESGVFTLYLNGATLTTGTDNTYTTNQYFGFRHNENPSGGDDHIIHEIRIETMGDGKEHNILTWNPSIDDPDEVSHYDIYCSDSPEGPWDESMLLHSVPANGSAEYHHLDSFKGMADETYWWYVVRAVGENGLVEENVNAIQEPGAEIITFTLELYSGGDSNGWNFVSFNLTSPDSSLENILENPDYGISGNYDRLIYFDASAGTWLSYVPGRLECFNNLQSWDHTMGIWIRMTADDGLTIEGTTPTNTTLTLQPGWNMVGLPSSDVGNHNLPAEVTTVGYFQAAEEYNVAYTTIADTFIFEPGQGYWLYNSGNQTVAWTVDYRL
ncbi:MAG: M14 family zinc carboxypeptidase [Thermoplasmata archaeon]